VRNFKGKHGPCYAAAINRLKVHVLQFVRVILQNSEQDGGHAKSRAVRFSFWTAGVGHVEYFVEVNNSVSAYCL
jgi:hypothetical protein